MGMKTEAANTSSDVDELLDVSAGGGRGISVESAAGRGDGVDALTGSAEDGRHGRQRMGDVATEQRTRFDAGRLELGVRPLAGRFYRSLAAPRLQF